MKYSDQVKFLPWEGEDAQYGIKGFDDQGHIIYGTADDPGKKLLALGESLYCFDEEMAKDPEITIKTIRDLIDPNSVFEPYKNTFTKFSKSLAGYFFDDFPIEEKTKLWQHIMFYNYVQVPMTSARVSPTREDFKKSEPAFWEVLEKTDADLVIVWGKRLYNYLPQTGEQAEDLAIVDGEFYGDATEIWSYEVNSKQVQVMYVNHPSAAYALEYWGAFISQFIKERG